MDRRLTKYLFIAFGLVALIACLALASQNASAIDAHLDYDGWEWWYTVGTENTLNRVVQTGAGTEITIPANLDGSTPLTTIAAQCFNDAEGHKITKVLSMPVTVTSLGQEAIANCALLTSVNVGMSGLVSTGYYGISQNSQLVSVILPATLTTVDGCAFAYDSALTSITFLGLVAPTSVGGSWIVGCPAGIRGHAYSTSNFPAPGNDFHGLTMGDYIYVAPPVLYPPIITTLPTLSVNIGYSYTYSALANQSVVWVITSNASWASISNNSISGIVNILDVGEYYVHIVGRNANGTAYQNYTVTIMAPITTLSDTSIIWLVLLLTFTAIGIIRVRLFGIFTGIIWIVAALIFFYPSYGYILMLFPLGFGMLWMVISLNELMSTEVKA